MFRPKFEPGMVEIQARKVTASPYLASIINDSPLSALNILRSVRYHKDRICELYVLLTEAHISNLLFYYIKLGTMRLRTRLFLVR
jgi:hypothetical protein